METVDWLVIGAGCSGIAAIGKLLDNHIEAKKIGWLDPNFQVGDLGEKWFNVPSNTHVSLFLAFLYACQSFNYDQRNKSFLIDSLDPNETCYLRDIVAPLQWITDHLMKTVRTFQGEALALNFFDGYWDIKLKDVSIRAKKVVLAIGADPKILSLTNAPPLIPLEIALNPEKLGKHVQADDTIGVFGSSHSAVLILAQLLKLNLQKVYNFYKHPHIYAIYLEDWILFDDSGLKGFAAKWAKEHLDDQLPPKLKRIPVCHASFYETLSLCNKVIYAVGFERRKIPVLEQYEQWDYQHATGIIAPNLFGVGIAFPQAKFDPFGNLEYRVGLSKFMDHLNTMVPIWIRYASS
jgi:hypothetical protein